MILVQSTPAFALAGWTIRRSYSWRTDAEATKVGGISETDLEGRMLMKPSETVAQKRNENQAVEATAGLGREAVTSISSNLRHLLADVFALYLKTKNFHWHIAGGHFRDYHLLLDEQATQLFAMTDDIAERARKLGGTTLHSISDITNHQRLRDNNDDIVASKGMLIELAADNHQLVRFLRDSHELCAQHKDVATTSLIEGWIDESERRAWFLREILNES